MGKEKKGWRMFAPVVIGRYWLLQGMLYMNRVELCHRALVGAVCTAAAWFALAPVASSDLRLLLALVLGHTLNMLLNGHVFALLKHDLYWFGFYKDWNDFSAYVEGMRERLRTRPCRGLRQAAIYGSITRGSFSASSDLDIRFIARAGFANGFSVAHRVFVERVRAFLAGFPLDLYMVHSHQELARKINLDREEPIVLYDFTHRAYPVKFRDAARPRTEACHG